MTVHSISKGKPPKPPEPPKPHEGIVLLLRGLLAQAEAGDIHDLASVWMVGDEILEVAYTKENNLSLGAITYALAHTLMTGGFDDG